LVLFVYGVASVVNNVVGAVVVFGVAIVVVNYAAAVVVDDVAAVVVADVVDNVDACRMFFKLARMPTHIVILVTKFVNSHDVSVILTLRQYLQRHYL
jgi:hypothetical protein